MKRGRPKLPKNAGKDSVITVRLTQAERDSIEKTIKESGESVSVFCRRVLLVAKPKAKEVRRQWSSYKSDDCVIQVLNPVPEKRAKQLIGVFEVTIAVEPAKIAEGKQ